LEEEYGLPCESREVLDAFPSVFFSREMLERECESVEVRGEPPEEG